MEKKELLMLATGYVETKRRERNLKNMLVIAGISIEAEESELEFVTEQLINNFNSSLLADLLEYIGSSCVVRKKRHGTLIYNSVEEIIESYFPVQDDEYKS